MGDRRSIRAGKDSAATSESFLAEIDACWVALATRLSQSGVAPLAQQAERLGRQSLELVLFLQFCATRQLIEPAMGRQGAGKPAGDLAEWIAAAGKQIGAALLCPADANLAALPWGDPSVAAVLARLSAPRIAEHLAAAPPEILGWIHQRLLSLRLAGAQGRGAAETSHAAKKAYGAFYTPEYVIRHMVAGAVGKQLGYDCPSLETGCGPAVRARGHGPSGSPLPRILDPACGCGFFLLGASRFLTEWCDRHEIHHAPRWIAQCLHGTDVDEEAVATARRSLWLELVGSRGLRAGGSDSAEMAGRILAELTGNIRCGDALTDSAWPAGWDQFDVVLGNPPYRRELNAKHLFDPLAHTPWARQHRAPRMDLWYYFVHRGLELLKPGARLSFIVDSYWTSSRGAAKLVAALQKEAWIEEVFSLGRARVFDGVCGRHMILSLVKGPGGPTTTVKRAAAAEIDDAQAILGGKSPLVVFQKTAGQLFRGGRVDLEPPADELLAKLSRWPRLASLGIIRQGIVENPASVTASVNRQHGDPWRIGEGVFALTHEEAAGLHLSAAESALLRKYHTLADLGRYFRAETPSRQLIYCTAQTCPRLEGFPALHAHLARFRPIMERRRETRLGRRPWWQLHWPREENVWQAAKLISVQMGRRPAFVAAELPVYVPFSANVFVPGAGTQERLDFLAAVLNSRLLWKWFSHHAKRRGVGLEINGHVLAETPIRTIDFDHAPDVAAHERLAQLGRQMARWSGRLRSAESKQEGGAIARRRAATDHAIDLAVYALYGLTDEEIAMVENAELSL